MGLSKKTVASIKKEIGGNKELAAIVHRALDLWGEKLKLDRDKFQHQVSQDGIREQQQKVMMEKYGSPFGPGGFGLTPLVGTKVEDEVKDKPSCPPGECK